jgi:hypothetical protein
VLGPQLRQLLAQYSTWKVRPGEMLENEDRLRMFLKIQIKPGEIIFGAINSNFFS